MQAAPTKATPHEQALAAYRNLSAGQRVARQATDVAPIAQDDSGLVEPLDAESRVGQCHTDAHLGRQRYRPGRMQAQGAGTGADAHGVQFHRGAQQ
ncbi:hypothetical protein D3C84_623030 [compost metagenome]